MDQDQINENQRTETIARSREDAILGEIARLTVRIDRAIETHASTKAPTTPDTLTGIQNELRKIIDNAHTMRKLRDQGFTYRLGGED